MRTSKDLDRVIGVIAIVIGVLVLLGWFSLGFLVPLLGVVLIVVGVLILAGMMRGSQTMGIVFLVLGVLLAAGYLPFVRGVFALVLNIVVGVVLIMVGISKVR